MRFFRNTRLSKPLSRASRIAMDRVMHLIHQPTARGINLVADNELLAKAFADGSATLTPNLRCPPPLIGETGMVTTIYRDDAGFTGDKLLDADRPFSGYSAVAIEPDAAAALAQESRARFAILGPEIRARKIYEHADALHAARWFAENVGYRATVIVKDKLFSLACKIFEYIYEPVLASDSLLFYERGFNLQVANIIWSHLRFEDNEAARIAERFQTMLSRKAGAPPAGFEQFSSPPPPCSHYAVRPPHPVRSGDGKRKAWGLAIARSHAR